MKKKLKIKFWKTERALAMQILEQEGLPEFKEEGDVRIVNFPSLCKESTFLRGYNEDSHFCLGCSYFETNQERDEYFNKVIKAITD